MFAPMGRKKKLGYTPGLSYLLSFRQICVSFEYLSLVELKLRSVGASGGGTFFQSLLFMLDERLNDGGAVREIL